MVTTGRLPLRAPRRRPRPADERRRQARVARLPVRRASTRSRSTRRSGQLVNWNNKAARGFEAADNAWNYGSSHRVDLLNRNLAKRREARPRVGVGGDERRRDAGPARRRPDADAHAASCAARRRRAARAAQMLSLLRAWRDDGGLSRLDRDLDGKIDAPGAAIMDAAWPRLADAVMGPVLGPQLEQLAAARAAATTQPPARPVRAAGTPTSTRTCATCSATASAAPFRERYCGAGDAGGVPDVAVGGARRGGRRARGGAGRATRPPGAPTRRASASRSSRACCRRRCATRTGRPASSRSSRSTGTAPRVTSAGAEAERVRRSASRCRSRRAPEPRLARVLRRASKRCFVMFLDDHHGDGRVALWCAAPEGMQGALVRAATRESYFVPPYVGHRGWTRRRAWTAPCPGTSRRRHRGRVAQIALEAPGRRRSSADGGGVSGRAGRASARERPHERLEAGLVGPPTPPRLSAASGSGYRGSQPARRPARGAGRLVGLRRAHGPLPRRLHAQSRLGRARSRGRACRRRATRTTDALPPVDRVARRRSPATRHAWHRMPRRGPDRCG